MEFIKPILILALSAMGPLLHAAALKPTPSDSTVSESVDFGQARTGLSERARRQLLDFAVEVDSVLRTDSLLSISVSGSASPDGPEKLNERLAADRAAGVRDFLADNSDIPSDIFTLHPKGEDWERFRQLIADDPAVPMRREVLGIIDSDEHPAIKERSIRRLGGGEPWNYLTDNIFPRLRIAVVDVSYLHSEPARQIIAAPPAGEEASHTDYFRTTASGPETEASDLPVPPAADTKQSGYNHLYVKTNLPAWLMLWINVAGEIDIAPHWSANLSVYYAGYDYFSHDIKFRNFTVMPEVRYWFRADNDGFFIGPHLGMAYYNVAFGGSSRYQDHNGDTPALGGGMSAGFRFALPRNPKWKLEFSLGAGVYRLDYDIFDNRHNGLLTGRRKRTFFGIDNVAFSICRTFDLRRKGGGK